MATIINADTTCRIRHRRSVNWSTLVRAADTLASTRHAGLTSNEQPTITSPPTSPRKTDFLHLTFGLCRQPHSFERHHVNTQGGKENIK